MTRYRRAAATAAALALLPAVALVPHPVPAAAAAGDYDIVAGDQASGSLIRYAPEDRDWNANPSWQWRPAAPDFTADDVSAFRLVSDMKRRITPDGAERFVTTASYGLMALLTYPEGRRIWSARVSVADNPHAIELLPDGNVAVAASSGGWVRVYATGGAGYAEFRLPGAHAAVWDPVIGRLWTIGDLPTGRLTADGQEIVAPTLVALEVYGPADRPGLREDVARRRMFDAGTMSSDYSHDAYADASRPNTLWITTNRTVFRYETTTGRTTEETGAAARTQVKSIGVQPSGVMVQTRPDTVKTPPGPCTVNGWCTSSVDLIDSGGTTTTLTRDGAAFYKARVWTPYSTAVDRPARGKVWVSARTGAGGWSTRQVDGNPLIAGLAAAGGHVFTLVPGSGVWERIDGGASRRVDDNGTITRIAAATDASARTHLFTVVPGSGVWEQVDGGAARRVDDNGTVTRIAAALGGDGRLHLFTLVPGGGVSERVASGSGWSAGTQVDRNAAITAIAAATGADGRLRLFTVVPGSGVWERVHDGTAWPGSSKILSITVAGGNRIADIDAIAAARAGDQLFLSATRSGTGVETYRAAGSGTGWTLDRADTTRANVLDVFTAGLPDGSLQVGTLPEVS